MVFDHDGVTALYVGVTPILSCLVIIVINLS